MKNYRDTIKEHFQNQPVIRDLLAADIVIYSFGLLFLFFSEWSIISVKSDIFFALGVWLFLIGIVLSFIRNNNLNLSFGLGTYALIYLVSFIIDCVHSTSYGGFYGFFALFNLAAASYLFYLSVRETEYYKKAQEQKKAAPKVNVPVSNFQKPNNDKIICLKCGHDLGPNTPFCPHCGNTIPEMRICKQCGSKLPENTIFCVACGTKVEAEEIILNPETNELKPEEVKSKLLCPSCGSEIAEGRKFCTKCGTKLAERIRCKQCGSQLPDNSNICVICGAEIGSALNIQKTEINNIAITQTKNMPVLEKIPETMTSDIIPEIVEAKKVCPSCGVEIIGNKKFCIKCGTKLPQADE